MHNHSPATDHAQLTDRIISEAKPAAKPYKLTDAGCSGLWVEVNSATKAFRTTSTVAGKTRQITLGHHPKMSLAAARAARLALRREMQARRTPPPPVTGIASDLFKLTKQITDAEHRMSRGIAMRILAHVRAIQRLLAATGAVS